MNFSLALLQVESFFSSGQVRSTVCWSNEFVYRVQAILITNFGVGLDWVNLGFSKSGTMLDLFGLLSVEKAGFLLHLYKCEPQWMMLKLSWKDDHICK